MLTKEDIAQFKQRLEEEKARMLKDIKELESPPDFGNEPGPDDETGESEQAFDNEASAQSYRIRIAEIDAALSRIEKETYGICEKTGQEIPKEVLEVNPITRYHPDYLKSQK